MKEYKINRQQRAGENYETMVVRDHVRAEIAEYRLSPGRERAEIASLRRSIDRHLSEGGTLGNYQW